MRLGGLAAHLSHDRLDECRVVVPDLEPRQKPLHARRERVVGCRRRGPQGVSAPGRNDLSPQHGDVGNLAMKRVVGMPILVLLGGLVFVVLDRGDRIRLA